MKQDNQNPPSPLGSPRSRCQQRQCLGKILLPVHRRLTFCRVPTFQKRQASSLRSLYKGTNPFHEGSTLMT
uniref:Uncharacterized protein n=1 Tax=Sus scrofa TaxID=9823 RepID=A0A8W4FFT6_PIG